jgi:DNA-binding protein
MSERPAGNLFSTIAKAYTPAVDEYLKGQETEDSFQRQLRLAGATQALQSEEAKAKYEKEMALTEMKLEQGNKELFLKANSDLGGKALGLYDTIKKLEEKKVPFSKIRVDSDLVTAKGGVKIPKPKQEYVLTVPEGTTFYDNYANLYKRSKDTPGGYVRLDQTGKEIPSGPAPVKSPGFFESPGAAYDPRAWNKQKFYDSLINKNKTSNME